MEDMMLEQEGYDLMGAVFEVYNVQGHGFLEEVYQECLEIELEMRSIPFVPQCDLNLYYKEQKLKKRYVPDFLVNKDIVLEIKAVKKLLAEHEAQLINYLHATKKRVGYLVNFGNTKELEWKRIII
ncbi:GxxExxY protein [Pontiellaceae bacterium B12227]|nr:GxxExxY protein [Pontiellaceae bacterium B12227]